MPRPPQLFPPNPPPGERKPAFIRPRSLSHTGNCHANESEESPRVRWMSDEHVWTRRDQFVAREQRELKGEELSECLMTPETNPIPHRLSRKPMSAGMLEAIRSMQVPDTLS